MLGRALYLFVAGALGGLIAWALVEPTAPSNLTDVAWARFEQWFGILAGLCIGLLIGAASGYSQGTRVHTLRGAAVGGLVGAIAGPFGVGLGSTLFNALTDPTRGVVVVGGLMEWVGRGLGWAMFGLVIGLAEGALGLSARRTFLGGLGGLIGGFIGGLMFQVTALLVGNVTAAVQDGSEVGTLPRAVGLVALGGGIGLFIGIVEAMGRQAWVRQLVGRNEGKEWMIDAPQTVLGRAEGVHVPLLGDPNVAPQHAMIVRQRGTYVLVDQGTPLGTGLNGMRVTAPMVLASGDLIQVGTHNLQFLLKGGAAKRAAAERMGAVPVAATAPLPAGTGGYAIPAPASGVPTQAFPTAPFPAPTMGMTPPGTVTQAAPMPLVLVAVAGPLAGTRIPVGASLEVGREGSGVTLASDAMASRRHARVDPAPGGLTVTDLGSTNGTFINGQRVPSGFLRPGDTVRIGSTEFRLEL